MPCNCRGEIIAESSSNMHTQTMCRIHAGPGGWNDADFIYTGGQGCSDNRPLKHCPGQTDTEYRTEFSMWCMMGSSLLIATDIRNMTDIMKEVCIIESVYRLYK